MLALSLVASTLAAPSIAAPLPFEHEGAYTHAVGDLDGDGFSDFAVGVALPGASRAAAVSGRDGTLLLLVGPEEAGWDTFVLDGAPDFDADGRADLALVRDLGRSVRLISGADGSVAWELTSDEPLVDWVRGGAADAGAAAGKQREATGQGQVGPGWKPGAGPNCPPACAPNDVVECQPTGPGQHFEFTVENKASCTLTYAWKAYCICNGTCNPPVPCAPYPAICLPVIAVGSVTLTPDQKVWIVASPTAHCALAGFTYKIDTTCCGAVPAGVDRCFLAF